MMTMMLASARCPPLCIAAGGGDGNLSGGGRQQYPGVQPGGAGVPLNLPKPGVKPPRRGELEGNSSSSCVMFWFGLV